VDDGKKVWSKEFMNLLAKVVAESQGFGRIGFGEPFWRSRTAKLALIHLRLHLAGS
jgi:hypothetical protein